MLSKFFHSKPLKTGQQALQTQESENALSDAVHEYMHSISQGQYNPKLSEISWSPADEASYIQKLLNYVSENLETLDIPESLTSSVPCIANLLASLVILKEITDVSPKDRLKKLEKIGVMAQVTAGMPGPCLVYIRTLLGSSEYDDISKVNLLGGVINNIKNRMDTFGALSHVVLAIAIKEWFSIANSLSETSQSFLLTDRKKFTALKNTCSLEKSQKRMTFIDECIVQVWEKLDIDTGSKKAADSVGSPSF